MKIQFVVRGYRDDQLVYEETKTQDQIRIEMNLGYYLPWRDVFDRWNSQTRSKITGVKWIYTPIAGFRFKPRKS